MEIWFTPHLSLTLGVTQVKNTCRNTIRGQESGFHKYKGRYMISLFHIFLLHRAHDINSDNLLDGLEILEALRHGAARHMARALAKHLTPSERHQRVNSVIESLSSKRHFLHAFKAVKWNESGAASFELGHTQKG